LGVNKSESDYQKHEVSTESDKYQVFWKTVKETETLMYGHNVTVRLHNKENNIEMKQSIKLQFVSLLWGCKIYKWIKYYFNSHFLLTTL